MSESKNQLKTKKRFIIWKTVWATQVKKLNIKNPATDQTDRMLRNTAKIFISTGAVFIKR
uniref:Uncharacterized protein n=1 Tax=Romanomermis culicivorax TaxID=13658 RepID=A0A915I973_ROMCU